MTIERPARTPAEHQVDLGDRVPFGRRDDDAPAEREAVGLDHHRYRWVAA